MMVLIITKIIEALCLPIHGEESKKGSGMMKIMVFFLLLP